MEIAASLSSDLVSVLQDDLTQPTERDTDSHLRDRLQPLIQGLMRTRGLKEGLLSWCEVVLGLVRHIVQSVSTCFFFDRRINYHCPSIYQKKTKVKTPKLQIGMSTELSYFSSHMVAEHTFVTCPIPSLCFFYKNCMQTF